MRRYLVLVVALALVGCSSWPWRREAANPDPNHTHADFAVWVNGEQFDFSRKEFMSEKEEEDEEHEKHGHRHHPYLHSHDGIGHVIHRHKPGLPLREFFKALGISLGTTCVSFGDRSYCEAGSKRWRMYVNGEERSFDPGYVFADTDTILLTYGSSVSEIEQQISAVTSDACFYSKTCPWRGEPPTENCIADPAIPCVAPLD